MKVSSWFDKINVRITIAPLQISRFLLKFTVFSRLLLFFWCFFLGYPSFFLVVAKLFLKLIEAMKYSSETLTRKFSSCYWSKKMTRMWRNILKFYYVMIHLISHCHSKQLHFGIRHTKSFPNNCFLQFFTMLFISTKG